MVRVARVDGADNDHSVAAICGAVSAGGHTRLLMGLTNNDISLL